MKVQLFNENKKYHLFLINCDSLRKFQTNTMFMIKVYNNSNKKSGIEKRKANMAYKSLSRVKYVLFT